ncbi:MAG TPA: class I SAM-dependent methyltransferase [Bryobacteraceae bacterium]|jgi:SAM-dependent methyltransferase
MAETATRPDYGLDSPLTVKAMFWRGGWTFVFGLVLFMMNRAQYPDVSVRILIVLGLIAAGFVAAGFAMVRSSRVGKLEAREKILDALALTGEERVLDWGTGRGLMLVGVAKRLKGGRVTGLDFTSEAEAARANAKAEGVLDKVRVDAGDPLKMTYPDKHYDVVVSALALHQVADQDDRDQAIREMLRVLKPGGRIAIYDGLSTGQYAKALQTEGAQGVELSPLNWASCLPTRTVTAKK